MKKLLLAIALIGSTGMKAQTEGDIFFATPAVHDVYMTFPQANYWDSLVNYMPLEQYLKADITIDGILYTNVGIKFKGNSSYSNPSPKKPFKIDMNEFVAGQDIDGLKKFNLNNGFKDPSFMREKIALDFYNEHGLAAPRCAYTRVFINGIYWGLYMFVEEANKTFLDDDDRFGNKQGNFFKGDPSGDLKWLGSTPSLYYGKYELHTNEIANDWTDLVELINKINNSGGNFYDSLETILNTNSFIEHWAAMNLFSNLDSYIGSGHNYFVYHDTLSDKFEWVTWDVNESFGNFTMGMTTTQMKNLSMFYVTSPSGSRPLVQNMLTNTTYKNLLINTFCQWVAYDFSNAAMDAKIDSLANAIRADVYADTKKFYTNANFDNNLTMDVTVAGGPPGGGTIIGIKNFITDKRNALMTELGNFGCFLGVDESIGSANNMIVYPNPAADHITVEFKSAEKENNIRIYNSSGQLVLSRISVDQSENIDISALSTGLYLIQINARDHFKFQKTR